jgi:hypothetical protein
MGGAIGVALIGSVVSSVFAHRINLAGARFDVSGSDLSEARSSLGGALRVADSLPDQGSGFGLVAKEAFVHGLSWGLRLASVFVAFAAVVVWRYLPARAVDHDHVPAATDDELSGLIGSVS